MMAFEPPERMAVQRRRFIRTALASGLFVSFRAAAETATVPIVGFLNSASASTYSFNADAFREGLREAGYVEGKNVTIDYRWANNDYAALPGLARNLAQSNVAVIAATGDI